MRNQRGFITVDFIFAVVLILGFTAMMFVLSLTLTVASITQYVTFAAARNYVVAHLDQATQEKMAQDKYHELIAHKVFKPLYANGWFAVDADSTIGDHTKIYPDYATATQGVNEFWGVGTRFVAMILDFQIPFFGSTAPEGDGKGSGFKTYMGSYLGREPSAEECIKFTAARWEAIRNLGYSSGTSTNSYHPMTDDGC